MDQPVFDFVRGEPAEPPVNLASDAVEAVVRLMGEMLILSIQKQKEEHDGDQLELR
jgi:hypothetical protein